MSNTEKYPELLVDLNDKFAEMFGKRGMEQAVAQALARDCVELIRREWGGVSQYIPKGLAYVLSQRDFEIYRAFDGTNIIQLCRKYELTEQRIYQIVKAVREEVFRKKQTQLF